MIEQLSSIVEKLNMKWLDQTYLVHPLARAFELRNQHWYQAIHFGFSLTLHMDLA